MSLPTVIKRVTAKKLEYPGGETLPYYTNSTAGVLLPIAPVTQVRVPRKLLMWIKKHHWGVEDAEGVARVVQRAAADASIYAARLAPREPEAGHDVAGGLCTAGGDLYMSTGIAADGLVSWLGNCVHCSEPEREHVAPQGLCAFSPTKFLPKRFRYLKRIQESLATPPTERAVVKKLEEGWADSRSYRYSQSRAIHATRSAWRKAELVSYGGQAALRMDVGAGRQFHDFITDRATYEGTSRTILITPDALAFAKRLQELLGALHPKKIVLPPGTPRVEPEYIREQTAAEMRVIPKVTSVNEKPRGRRR